jgi:hypothetical protein
MSQAKNAIRNIVPDPLWNRLGLMRRVLIQDRLLEWYLGTRGRQSRERLRSYKDRHLGERCFILGNGPSLRETDLSLLRNEATFGLNRIYLLFGKNGFSTTYLVSVNELVIQQCASELASLPCPKFFSWRARSYIEFTPSTAFLLLRRGPAFGVDVTKGIWTGTTVTYVAMQLAYYMGFQKVVLIGVDHSFTTKGKPHTTVLSKGDDLDHFDRRYFGKGFRWQLPDLDTSEVAYRVAKSQFQQDGREIVDATIGGQLDIFPKVKYKDLFD